MEELNELGYNIEVEDIVEYFSKMDLTDEQKEEREDLADKLKDYLLIFLNLVAIQIESARYNRDYLINTLNAELRKIISENYVIDDYLNRYVNHFSSAYVDLTYLHLMKDENKEWWTSEDRATVTAEEESNGVVNYVDYTRAKEQGYTKKKWITEKDERVRKTHRPLNDKVIDIDKPFQVGNSLMLFPKDTSFFASEREIVNCRCVAKYIK